jgi:hypothetical protein
MLSDIGQRRGKALQFVASSAPCHLARLAREAASHWKRSVAS